MIDCGHLKMLLLFVDSLDFQDTVILKVNFKIGFDCFKINFQMPLLNLEGHMQLVPDLSGALM